MAQIRSEGAGDAPAIRALHQASFPTPGEAALVDALRSAGRLLVSLIAEEAGVVVGHVAFSPVRGAGARDGAALAPVAVLPAFRRRGIAERLIREGLAACRRSGRGFVVVLGDPPYYGRFGFLPAARWGLRSEYGDSDPFQTLELRPDALPRGRGWSATRSSLPPSRVDERT